MIPEIEIHKHVAIRYGYSISDDQFHAHFDLPLKEDRLGFQRSVSMHLSPGPSSSKRHVVATSDIEVLNIARTAIDAYLAE